MNRNNRMKSSYGNNFTASSLETQNDEEVDLLSQKTGVLKEVIYQIRCKLNLIKYK